MAASPGIQVISRAADVLRALHGEPDGLSLSQLAQRTGLPRSTVHRLLAALEAESFVAPSGPSGRMALGPELLRLAGQGPPDVQARLRPVMDVLFDDLQETVDLAVLDGDHLRFVDQIPAPHRLRAVSSVGTTFPLLCTANGKAVLTLFDDDDVKRLLPARLPQFTEHTITSRRALLNELAEVRASGLATDLEEHTLGISAIGFAVGDPSGAHGAVTVPMPTQRFAGREGLLRSTMAAAREDAARRLLDAP